MEYTDINTPILVYNLPLFERDSQLYLKNITTMNIVDTIPLKDCIDLIEYSLLEIIDLLIKKALNKYSQTKYCIVGGKAINNIISLKYLKKSFDFDIHVDKIEDIETISRFITRECNNEINLYYNKIWRYQIYSKLLNLNLIDRSLKNYYMNQNLIFWGERYTRNKNLTIKGLFIKIKLRDNIFCHDVKNPVPIRKNISYNNFCEDKSKDVEDLTRDNNNNTLYIPISDIEEDSKLNFGVTIFNQEKDLIYKNPTEDVNYPDFPILFFNLIRYLEISPNKLNSNIIKYNKIIEPLNYNCNICRYYDLKKFNKIIKNIFNQIKFFKDRQIFQHSNTGFKKEISDNKVKYIDNTTTYQVLINFIINKIIHRTPEKNRICPIILGPGTTKTNFLFWDGVEHNNLLQQLELILEGLDTQFYLLAYTNYLYRNLNTYCNFINNS